MGVFTRLFGRWVKASSPAVNQVSLTPPPKLHNQLKQSVSSGSYTYSPLSGLEEIRLLNLQRRPDGTLACSIRHAHINQASFTALSYAWGDVDSSYLLPVVDEDDSEKLLGFIPLTNNLNDALQDLEASSEVGETHFWIDQVCINQGDVNERNHQVALMKKIYGRARRVVTYVGPEEPGDPEALDLLLRIHNHFKPYYNTSEINGLTAGQTVPPHLQFECDDEDPAWKQLYKIATGEWSCRLWMVQENLLNRDTVMLRGRRVLPWIALPAISSLRASGLLPHEGETFGHGAYLQLCRHWLFPEPGLVVTTSTTILVWHALQLFSSHLCSDPRDKVFGLLAITSDAEALGIVADYNKTLSEVLIDVAFRILVNSGMLWVFDVAFFDEAIPGVPSWVPKWTGQNVMISGRATRGANIMWAGTPDPSALRIYGFAVDKMARNLGQLPNTNWIWRRRGREEVLGLFCDLLRIIISAKTELVGAENADALICSTLLSDPKWPAGGAAHTALAGRAFRHYLGYMRDSFGDDFDDQIWKRFVDTYEPALEREQFSADCDGDGGVARARDAEYIATLIKSTNRAVFATDDGNICLATRCAQPGDVVAALYGGQSLYVLRPKGNQFQYVGDAYIHGHMDGEVLDDPRYTRQVFELV